MKGKVIIFILIEFAGLASPLGRPISSEPPRLKSSVSYPSSLDYRDLGKVTPVKDQGYCGSCWAFSTLAMYESYLAIEDGELYDLSEQYVLDCTSSGDCYGGWPEDAVDMFIGDGIPLESTFSYQ